MNSNKKHYFVISWRKKTRRFYYSALFYFYTNLNTYLKMHTPSNEILECNDTGHQQITRTIKNRIDIMHIKCNKQEYDHSPSQHTIEYLDRNSLQCIILGSVRILKVVLEIYVNNILIICLNWTCLLNDCRF